MNWRQRATWATAIFSLAATVALTDGALRVRPESARPGELYAVVAHHLAACRSADFPQVYRSAANRVQEQFSLVQFERKLRRDYQTLAGVQHVEYGAVYRTGDSSRASVDVFFVSRHGGAVAWKYDLVFEDGSWKVERGAPIAEWPAGQRLGGMGI